MLPKVDNTFVKFTLYSKVYKDSNIDKEKGVEAKTADWCAENVVYGSEYKAFGFTTAESLETKKVLNGWQKKPTSTNLLMWLLRSNLILFALWQSV